MSMETRVAALKRRRGAQRAQRQSRERRRDTRAAPGRCARSSTPALAQPGWATCRGCRSSIRVQQLASWCPASDRRSCSASCFAPRRSRAGQAPLPAVFPCLCPLPAPSRPSPQVSGSWRERWWLKPPLRRKQGYKLHAAHTQTQAGARGAHTACWRGRQARQGTHTHTLGGRVKRRKKRERGVLVKGWGARLGVKNWEAGG